MKTKLVYGLSILLIAAGAFAAVSDQTVSGVLTLVNTGLHILDTDGSHDLIIQPGSNLTTSDKTLTITTGDASRTLTMSADATIPDARIGSLTNTKWCTTDGTTINCTSDSPASTSLTGASSDTISNAVDNQWLFTCDTKESLYLDCGTTENVVALASASGVTNLDLDGIAVTDVDGLTVDDGGISLENAEGISNSVNGSIKFCGNGETYNECLVWNFEGNNSITLSSTTGATAIAFGGINIQTQNGYVNSGTGNIYSSSGSHYSSTGSHYCTAGCKIAVESSSTKGAETQICDQTQETLTFAADPGDASKTTTTFAALGGYNATLAKRIIGYSYRVTGAGSNCSSIDIGDAGGTANKYGNDIGITAGTKGAFAFAPVTAAPVSDEVTVTANTANCFSLVIRITAHVMCLQPDDTN